MADDEHARVVAVRAQQRDRVVAVEALGERLLHDRLDAERLAREPRGVDRAHLRARVAGVERGAEAGERGARGEGLSLAAGRQLSLRIGLGVVRHGLAVPEQPELGRHRAPDLISVRRSYARATAYSS